MGSLIARKKLVMMMQESGLPSAYQQIDSIKANYGSSTSSGAYIDTGIVPYLGLCSEVVIKMLANGYPFGSTSGANKDYYGWNAGSTTETGYCYLGTRVNSYIAFSGYKFNEFRTIVIDEKKFYIDGDLVGDYSNSANTYAFENAKSITLGALNSNGTTKIMTGSQIKNAKFWDKTTGNMIGNFVPCYRKSDNKVGLYDTVTKAFFASSGNQEYSIGT